MDYLILEGNTIGKLQEALNNHAKQGWRVVPGGVQVSITVEASVVRSYVCMIQRRSPWHPESEAE